MSVSRIPIRLIVEGAGEAEGELIRFLAPRTVEAIVHRLPVEGRAALWREEVYFEIPVKIGKEKAKAIVEAGTIAYWPMGSALCVFYERLQPYSPVNVIGRVTKNLDLFRDVKSGTKIVVERMQAHD
ncbi:MAG: cyclophilin-like fold protein [Candidatus Bathyarchaeia archaeon]